MPDAVLGIAGIGLFFLGLAGLRWLFRRPDFFDELPAKDVPHEPGIRGWYYARGRRRARALRREQQEKRHYQEDRIALTGRDPTDGPPPGY